MVYLATVPVFFLQISFVFTDLCVLEPLITISQPLCVRSSNCSQSNSKTRKIRSANYSAEELIPLVPLGSPSSGHFQSVKGNDQDDFITTRFSSKFVVNNKIKQNECKENSKYRTIDGSCNNLKHPEWGMSSTPFLRILYPRYSNSSSGGMVVSVSGKALPVPRILSTTLFPDVYRPWENRTLAVMQWGQLIAHDIGLSPSSTDLDLDCCAAKIKISQCCPIYIPKNDPFYSQFNVTCLNMIRTRSIMKKVYDCSEIPYQLNDVSHNIDMSFLYGSTFDTEHSLRQFEGGFLEVYLSNFREFPKLSDNPSDDCSSSSPNITCFHSGNRGINQNTQLTSLQTVLLREHNRLANQLAKLNSNWTDEKLFQESRNILIATFQHISYNEWLSLILGQDYMNKHNLKPLPKGFTNYNSNVNFATINSFMASAYRTLHSLIQGNITMYKENKCPFQKLRNIEGRCPFKSFNISDYMNRPGIIIQDNNFDDLLIGLTVEPSRKFGRYSNSLPGGMVVSASGKALPVPRILSTTLFPDVYRPWENRTLAVMQWGQLIAHDIGLSPSSTDVDLDCCTAKKKFSQCCPIYIPKNDPFYSQFNVTCLNMIRTRSMMEKAYDCSEIPYQLNDASHNIDVSFLYGSTSDTVYSLRQFEGGLLEVHLSNFREFPKLSDNPSFDCSSISPNITCFHSGDRRVNQNTQVTCLQTVLLREHNRLANQLAKLNSNWTDEKLFQESRNILIATFQHISYNDWLPLILGQDYMNKHNLKPLTEGFTNYNSNVNFATINSFMASAYRTLHSLIQGNITMYKENKCPFQKLRNNEGRCPFKSLNISDYMNRPGIIIKDNNFDDLLMGLTVESSRKVDRYFTKQMTEMMFHGDYPYGEDLESFDIQRGRDHGVPSYNVFRELCNLTRAKNFSDLQDAISIENINLLASVYEDVEDIDYFVGSVMEKWAPGAGVGPTVLCILGEQFARKKFGDRFWYEAGNQTNSFTEEQLQEIRKTSLSRLLCDNSDNITTIQSNSFLSYSIEGNEIVNCDRIPYLNITKWKE